MEPLSSVAYHHDGPLDRFVMLQKQTITGDGGFRVVAHMLHDVPDIVQPYCELHWHEFDEVNLILSEDDSLKYKIILEDEEYEVTSPATVYIPKGLKHSAEVLAGRGTYLAITFTQHYKAFQ